MSGDLISKFLENIGLRRSSLDEQVRTALKPITDITFDLSPMRAVDTSAWTIKILDRINVGLGQKIIQGIGTNAEVAAAAADKLLTGVYEMQTKSSAHDFSNQELLMLGNSSQFVDILNIPQESYRIPQWQKNTVSEFKKKYERGNYMAGKKFSTGSHLVVAVKLLEIANQGK